jgi:hypothetical protein
LEHLDREKPDASPLLIAIRQPHGPANVPIFNSRQAAQYQLLADWARQVAPQPRGHQSPSNAVRPAASFQPIPEGTSADDESSTDEPLTEEQLAELRAKWYQLEGDNDFRVTADGLILMSTDAGEVVDEKSDRPVPSKKPPIRGAAGMAQRPRTNVQRGVAPRVTPRDPFDPELFNRRFHPPR